MRLSLSKKLGNNYNFTERWKTKNDTKRINLFNAKKYLSCFTKKLKQFREQTI